MADTTTPTDFSDLDDFLVVEAKQLPVHGKTYTFPGEVSGRAWLLIQRTLTESDRARRARDRGDKFEPRRLVLSDEDEADLREEILGDTQDQLIADGIGSAGMQHIFVTLMAWHAYGREAALAIWSSPGGAQTPNRAARRASKGSGSTTLSSTSGSGTRSRTTSGAARVKRTA